MNEILLVILFGFAIMPSYYGWSINTILWKTDETTHVIDKPALIYMVVPLNNPCLEARDVFLKYRIEDMTKWFALADCIKAYDKHVKVPLETFCRTGEEQKHFDYIHLSKKHSTFYGSVLNGASLQSLNLLKEIYLPLQSDQYEELANVMNQILDLKFEHEVPSIDQENLTEQLSKFITSFNQFHQAFELGMNGLGLPQLGGKFYDLIHRRSESELRRRFLFNQGIETDCFATYASNKSPLLHVLMSVPFVNRDMIVIKADPFTMLVRNGDTACEVNYVGPSRLILNTNLSTLYPANDIDAKTKVVETPLVDPIIRNKLDDDSIFQIGSCFEFRNDTFQDYVQVKVNQNELYIYCPFSTITIGKTQEPCSDYPFKLAGSSVITINNKLYSSGLKQDKLGPKNTYSENVDWYLRPMLNLSRLRAEVPLLKFEQGEERVKVEKENEMIKEKNVKKEHFFSSLSFEYYISLLVLCVTQTVVIVVMMIIQLKKKANRKEDTLLQDVQI